MGTDDTRLNRLFLDLVGEKGPGVSGDELPARYLHAYQHPEAYFPGEPGLFRDNMAFVLDPACARLGVPSPVHPRAPREALRSGALGLGIPFLIGLISLPAAGCLCPGDPEAAYLRAFDLAFVDIGLARDLTAVQAAIVALAVAGTPLTEAVRRGLATDPYGTGNGVRERIRSWLEASAGLPDDRAFCSWLGHQRRGMHPYDAVAALGTALCCVQRSGGDFRRAVLLSVNQWEHGPDGSPWRLGDVDCFGSITGTICGACAGGAGIPGEWRSACLSANREAYGFDLGKAAERFARAVAQG